MWISLIIVIRPKYVLWYPTFHKFLSPIGLKYFCTLSDLLGYEMTNEKWVCNKKKSGTTTIPKYVPICTKFGTHIHWYGPSRQFFFFKKFIFNDFIVFFFLHFWDLADFWGGIQTMLKSIFYGFYEVNGPF